MKKVIVNLLLVLLLLCCGCSTTQNVKESSFKIYFFSVGHGDAALVMCDGHNMMIDCGSTNYSEGIQSMYMELDKLGIDKFDYIFVTHPDKDHYSLFEKVLETRNVKKVYCSTKSNVVNKSDFNNFENSFSNIFKKIKVPKVGDRFYLGEASIDVLSVNARKYNVNSNDSSIVLMITYRNKKFLFTGDAGRRTEEEILKNKYNVKCDVLKIAHHGSGTSSGNSFLNAAHPEYAVFSVSSDDIIDGRILDTLEESNPKTKIFRTDENGMIICTCDGNRIVFTDHFGKILSE